MAATTLDDAVKTAVQEVQKEEQQTETSQQKETTEKQETKQEDKTTQTETPEQIAHREKVDKALRLFDALSDPNIGKSVVEDLARRAGVIGAQEGKTEKQITSTVVDILKESLGTEYEFLADRLAVGIDKIVKQTVTEQIKPVQAQTQEAVERAVAAEVDAVFEKFHTAHKDAKDYDKEMTELSKKLPYTGDYPMEEYLENLYKIVTTDKKEAKVIKQTVDKINKNAQELRDSSTEVQETRVTKGSKLPSIDEAVKAAFRGEKLA